MRRASARRLGPGRPLSWKLCIRWKLSTIYACFLSAGCGVSTLFPVRRWAARGPGTRGGPELRGFAAQVTALRYRLACDLPASPSLRFREARSKSPPAPSRGRVTGAAGDRRGRVRGRGPHAGRVHSGEPRPLPSAPRGRNAWPRAAAPGRAATRAQATRQLASATEDASLDVLPIRRREYTHLTEVRAT